MGRHTNLRTAYVKGLVASSPQLTITDLHLMTGVAPRTLARWRRELAGDGGDADAAVPGPRARLAAAVADANRRAREAEEVCCRERGMSHGQLEEARVLFARDGHTADTVDTADGLLRSLVSCRHELGHTRRRLAEAEALLALWPPPAGRKGRKTTAGQRKEALDAIAEARRNGATLEAACARAGICVRTHKRWTAADGGEDRRKEGAAKRVWAARLSDAERARAKSVLAEPRFADKTAAHIVAALADEGRYVCSAATLTRIRRELRAAAPGPDAAKPRPPAPPAPRLCARAPNEVWVWDITLLPTTVRGRFFPAFVAMDLYSRMVVASAVHDTQDAEHAVALFTRAFEEHQIAPGTLTVHSDNGSAMRAEPTYACLRDNKADISHIRPGVSNDNAQAESLIRTLKRNRHLPVRPFGDGQAAAEWLEAVVEWYNNKHRHSALHHVTPSQRHRGEDIGILLRRCGVFGKAREEHPERWFSGRVFAPKPAREVWVNPPPSSRA